MRALKVINLIYFIYFISISVIAKKKKITIQYEVRFTIRNHVESALLLFNLISPSKSALMSDIERDQKNALLKNFTLTDFFGPIWLDSPNWGTYNSRKKIVNSPFNSKYDRHLLVR